MICSEIIFEANDDLQNDSFKSNNDNQCSSNIGSKLKRSCIIEGLIDSLIHIYIIINIFTIRKQSYMP